MAALRICLAVPGLGIQLHGTVIGQLVAMGEESQIRVPSRPLSRCQIPPNLLPHRLVPVAGQEPRSRHRRARRVAGEPISTDQTPGGATGRPAAATRLLNRIWGAGST